MGSIIRWNPIRDFFDTSLDTFFDDIWSPLVPSTFAGDNVLALDVQDSSKSYTVVTSLPGVKPEDIQVRLDGDRLTISGEVQQSSTRNQRPLIRERYYGRFSRSIRLPEPVDSKNAEAVYHNGVLTLTLPKAESAARIRRIPVKISSRRIPIQARPVSKLLQPVFQWAASKLLPATARTQALLPRRTRNTA